MSAPQRAGVGQYLMKSVLARQFNGDIDLRFDALMDDLQLPRRPAHNPVNDATMAALASASSE